jgi:hypothetical protein
MTQEPEPSFLRWMRENWVLVAAFIAAVSAIISSPYVLDIEGGPIVTLSAFAVFGVAFVWTRWRVHTVFRVLAIIAIVGAIAGIGYFVIQASQPSFEITTVDSLDNDPNAYEVTDMLIWNQDGLAQYGVGITFTLEIVPHYYGKQRFGKVVALISGDGGNTLEKPLWNAFTNEASAQQITLTLPELLRVSGLRTNSGTPANPFSSGGRAFQQARLVIQVAQATAKARPWSTQEIIIRNAPWELHSELVQLDDSQVAYAYVKNLGGPGEFTIRYRLARLEAEIGSETTIDAWNGPAKLVHLEKGGSFTDTFSVPDQLAQGRYYLEIYAVKKQNYVQFTDPSATWENLDSLNTLRWFSESPSNTHLFNVATTIPEAPAVQAERGRLKDELGVDLGLALKPAEDVSSPASTKGQRQVFQKGEVYVHDGQAYGLYGPILEHYTALGGVQHKLMGFPTSGVRAVTSVSGAEGSVAEFESSPPQGHTMIYASDKGVAEVQGWINDIYQKNGGPTGWMGFPLADSQYYSDSEIQMFEYGYIIYYYPQVEGKQDLSRPPVVYPYLASRGTLFDVHAEQLWQNTGAQVQLGDRVTIIQVDGTWTNEVDVQPFDANGDPTSSPAEGATSSSVRVGVLIGRIGEDDKSLFSVGRWSTFTSQAAGPLYLAMNDGYYEDNSGLITVQITVEHPK